MMRIILPAALVLIAAIFVFSFFNKTAPATKDAGQVSVVTSGEADEQIESRYLSYSEKRYNLNSGKKRILFFHAKWCPTCKVADEELTEKPDEIPEEAVIFKVDYDTETALKKKYAITYQHTFVLVDEKGNEVKKWNGGGLEEVSNNLDD